MSTLFEECTRKALRFDITKGYFSVEDLWNCSLVELNALAIKLNKASKEEEAEDFLNEHPKPTSDTKLKFDVVLHILEIKKTEKANRLLAIEKKANKNKLLAALARKEDEAIDNMSEAEIKKAIEDL